MAKAVRKGKPVGRPGQVRVSAGTVRIPEEAAKGVRVTRAQQARWQDAWGIGDEFRHVGWIDPLPCPPDYPCGACAPLTGGRPTYWIEVLPPHRGWRCVICAPVPDVQPPIATLTWQWKSDEELLPEPEPPPPENPNIVTTEENWWE